MKLNLQQAASFQTAYVSALSLLALLSLASFLIANTSLKTNETVVNVSGRQRMLSQRSALLAQQLATTNDAEQRARLRLELTETASLMGASHERLRAGKHTPALETLYTGELRLDAQVLAFLERLDNLLASPDTALTPDNPDLQAVLEVASGRLLNSLDTAVNLYEAQGSAQVRRFKLIMASLQALILATLIALGLFLFRPVELGIKARTEELTRAAMHDSLTGLPNRLLLLDRLSQALARRERDSARAFAVLYLDLNKFKPVNDTYGHAVGDGLLIAVGKRLVTCVRDVDTVARLGGDEFTILLENVGSPQSAETVAERVKQCFETPFIVEDIELSVSASIGLIMADEHHASTEAIVNEADAAMYKAKHAKTPAKAKPESLGAATQGL